MTTGDSRVGNDDLALRTAADDRDRTELEGLAIFDAMEECVHLCGYNHFHGKGASGKGAFVAEERDARGTLSGRFMDSGIPNIKGESRPVLIIVFIKNIK
jgi:hypothetical protein